MINLGYHIIPFDQAFEEQAMELERLCPQGEKIKFEISRSNILSRAQVFKDYQAYLAIDDNKAKVVGFAVVAVCPFIHNQDKIPAGIGFDMKVHPDYRQKGIARNLGKQLVDDFLAKKNIETYYFTLKKSNENIAKAAKVIPREWTFYDFVYLTLPTNKKFTISVPDEDEQPLNVVLTKNEKSEADFILDFESGLKLWKTYEIYQLRIQEWPWYMDLGVGIYNFLAASKKRYPNKKSRLKFATLFDFNTKNIVNINCAIERLNEMGIQFLNICCTKGDSIYKMLKPHAINILDYGMMSTGNIQSGSDLKMDVRCM